MTCGAGRIELFGDMKEFDCDIPASALKLRLHLHTSNLIQFQF